MLVRLWEGGISANRRSLRYTQFTVAGKRPEAEYLAAAA